MDTILYYKITEMTEQRINGRVKWFDSKKGYGFIEATGEERVDFFVHFSNISLSDETSYKKLFPGEYVSFVKANNSENGRVECREVKGVDGGPLLTENTEYRYKVFRVYEHRGGTDQEIAEVLNDADPEADDVN